MKFDLTIGNPPYHRGIDLRIHNAFQECASPCGRIVFVHPAMFLLSHKYNVKNTLSTYIDESKLESVHIFDGNNVFNVGLGVPVAITRWNVAKQNSGIEVKDDLFTNSTYTCNPYEIHMYGGKYGWLKNWLESNVDYKTNGSVGTHGRHFPTSDRFIVLPTGYGGGPQIIAKNTERMDVYLGKDKNYESGYRNVFSFDTDIERTNFINYLKTKCVRFILSMSKANQMMFRGELNQIPWMDFTKPYSDKALCAMWNVDSDLWKFIDSTISDTYDDYNYDGFYINKEMA